LSWQESPRVRVQVCEPEFQRTHDPQTGVLLARALFRNGDYEAAGQVARSVVETPRRGDALQLLGQVAIQTDRDQEALTQLEAARKSHQATNEVSGVAVDDRLLAEIHDRRDEPEPALKLLTECISELERVAPEIRCNCHSAAAMVFAHVGLFERA